MCPFFVFKEPGSQWFKAFLTESSAPHWIEGVWEIICGPPCWHTGPDGCLSKLTRLPIYFLVCFLLQSLLHFENSDMGWGAAHTQECRWVETGSNTHAREVSFHPLAVVRWGGSTPNQRGGKMTPSQTATCTAFQLIQPQNVTFGSLGGLSYAIVDNAMES